MAYYTRAEAEGAVNFSFTATSKPTATQVDDIIAKIEDEINGMLTALGVDPPATSTFLSTGAQYGSLMMIELSIHRDSNVANSRAEMYRRLWESWKKSLMKNPDQINDPATNTKGGADVDGKVDEDHQFKVDDEQW